MPVKITARKLLNLNPVPALPEPEGNSQAFFFVIVVVIIVWHRSLMSLADNQIRDRRRPGSPGTAAVFRIPAQGGDLPAGIPVRRTASRE